MAFLGADRGAHVSSRERALQRQRDEEERVRGLAKFAGDMAFLGAAGARDDAVEARRMKAERDALEREEMMERMTRTAMLEARRKARQAEQEEALALEMERRKREDEGKRREIQLICEADPSLRELQEKLKMAYVTKERVLQMHEKKGMAEAEAASTRALDAALEEARRAALEEERKREEERKAAAALQKEVLQKQLLEKEMRDFLEAEAEAAREKRMVDDIMAKLRAEDEAEMAAKTKAREETAAMIEEFKRQRHRALDAAREAEREEERRIAAYMAAQAAREEETKRAKVEDAAARDAKYRAIVAEQEAIRKRQEEEDALRWLLVEEEAEKRRAEAEEKRRADAERSRREMMTANEEQRRIRERIAVEEAAKEAALIQQFLAKCAEDDRKEAAARHAREVARARYMAEIQSQRDVKMALLQAQKMEELRALEEARRKEEFRKRVVEEARRKLLEEHAAVLRGFLPRGVLLSNADLDLLKAFDRNADGKLEGEELDLAVAAFKAFDPTSLPVKPAGAGGSGGATALLPGPAASALAPSPFSSTLAPVTGFSERRR